MSTCKHFFISSHFKIHITSLLLNATAWNFHRSFYTLQNFVSCCWMITSSKMSNLGPQWIQGLPLPIHCIQKARIWCGRMSYGTCLSITNFLRVQKHLWKFHSCIQQQRSYTSFKVSDDTKTPLCCVGFHISVVYPEQWFPSFILIHC
jgi:hypothetical protein